jgi:S1-C subfamily serine protease
MLASIAGLALLFLGLLPATTSAAQEGPDANRVGAGSLVQTSALLIWTDCPVRGDPEDTDGDDLRRCNLVGNGSGTIIESGGRILTNSHVVLDDYTSPKAKPIWLLVALTQDERSGAKAAFWAAPVGYDVDLDLAVVEPYFDLAGEPIERGDLDLPTLAFADSTDDLHLEDSIRLIGFPGVGGPSVTVIDSRVAGFLGDARVPQLGESAWIKANPSAGPGVSGGSAINEQGELIGVPTESIKNPVACTDLTGDGEVDLALECNVSGSDVQLVRPIEGVRIFLNDLEVAGGRDADRDGEDDDRHRQNNHPLQSADDEGDPAESEEATALVPAGVTATLVDAETGDPIEEGVIIVLKPGISLAEFDPENEDHYLTGGISDDDGHVELINPIERDQPYTVIIAAEGYEPIVLEDEVLAAGDDPEVVDLGEIELQPA